EAAGERADELPERHARGEEREVLVVLCVIRLACHDGLRAEGEREMADPDDGARCGEREGRTAGGKERAPDDLERAAEEEEARAVAPIGPPAERNRQEERNERERSGDDADGGGAVAETEQPVRRRRADDVHR